MAEVDRGLCVHAAREAPQVEERGHGLGPPFVILLGPMNTIDVLAFLSHFFLFLNFLIYSWWLLLSDNCHSFPFTLSLLPTGIHIQLELGPWMHGCFSAGVPWLPGKEGGRSSVRRSQ